jgi:hypothetical protein
MGRATSVSIIPPGTRAAKVKLVGTQRNTTLLQNLRIDADYAEPAGGFRPVKVTYTWEENGTPKQDVHIAQKPDDSYVIECQAKPTMKSIALELAP